jgi:undecaprenyl diphosphate synthase
MSLLVEAIKNETPELNKNDIKLETIGDIKALPEASYKSLLQAKEDTKNNKSLTLILALNYGGQMEITQAVHCIASKVKNGDLEINDIDESVISEHLHTAPFPNPDILIRTSNEMRISNFLLWQLAYAEFFFLEKYWPDFRKEDLFECVAAYNNRERRFGKTSEQLNG